LILSHQPLAPRISRSLCLALRLPKALRSNSFPDPRNSYPDNHPGSSCFEWFTDGKRFALSRNRRSGAQRGASENNFGQRFSVSTPCSSSDRPTALPAVTLRKMRASLRPARNQRQILHQRGHRVSRSNSSASPVVKLSPRSLRRARPAPARRSRHFAVALRPHSVSCARHRIPPAPCAPSR